jgi:hypothetical protein
VQQRFPSPGAVPIVFVLSVIALSASAAARQMATDVPGTPFNLTFTVTGSTVTLAWNPPATGDEPSAFIIEAGSASATANVAVLDTQNTLTSTTVTGVPAGTYYVRVRARNVSGISGPSNEVVVVVGGGSGPGPCASLPAPPSGLTASGSGDAFTLQWLGVPGALEYIVEAGSTSGAANITVFATGNAATALSGTAPAGTYYVRVRVRTACGISGVSNEAVLTLGRGTPLPPGSGLSGQWLGIGSDGIRLPNNDCVLALDLRLDVVQSGSAISGTATGRVREVFRQGEECDASVLGMIVSAPLTGTTTGSSIAFSFSTFVEEAFRVDLTGTVVGNRMGGTVAVVFADPSEPPEFGVWSVTRQ